MGEKKRKRLGMELFPDGRRVRLRSRGRAGMYLRADEDGAGAHLSPPLPESLHTAWQVHRVERGGVPFLLLQSAAYGRYLAATADPAPRGHLGERVVQGVYDQEDTDAVFWSPSTVAADDDHVILRHVSDSRGLCLRANGKYAKWRTGVSIGRYADRDPMMHWVVEPMHPAPELPPPAPNEAAPLGGFWNRFLGHAAPVVERRMIRFMRAADDGSIDPDDWREIEFNGRSVYNLRSAVARNLNYDSVDSIKLCVRAGNLGRLIPLVTDLPRNKDLIEIIVLSASAQDFAVVFDLPRNEEDIDIVACSTATENLDQLTPTVLDLPRNKEPIDIAALSTSTPGRDVLPEVAEAKLVVSECTLPSIEAEIGKGRDVLPEVAEAKLVVSESTLPRIEAEIGKGRDVLPEVAEAKLVVSESTLRSIEAEIGKAEENLRTLQRQMRNGKDLSKEDKKELISQMKAKKADIKRQRDFLVLMSGQTSVWDVYDGSD
ncbi:hypothetical protein EJB05_40436, partial [Eragrostis curvula]